MNKEAQSALSIMWIVKDSVDKIYIKALTRSELKAQLFLCTKGIFMAKDKASF